MKKLFAMAVCLIMTAALVVGATHSNAVVKTKAHSAVAVATVGALSIRPGAHNKNTGVYARLRKEFGKGRVIAPDMIRMERYLQNGATEYQFFHKSLGTASEAITERKLNEQDAFQVTELGIFLMRESTLIPGIGMLSTYPNPQQFPDGAAGFTVNEHLEHIYNGVFSVKVGDTAWFPGVPIMDCRVVNTAQQTALATNDSERRAGDGMIDINPQFRLKGRENNELKLLVPGNALQKIETDSANVNYKIKVVCILRGYKVTGAGATNS